MTTLSLDHFVKARAAMARRRAERRAVRFGKAVEGPPLDAPEMIGVPDDPPAPPMAFHLIYKDSRSALSARCFTLRSARAEIDEIRLSGICHMRSAVRSFLASRMVEVTDLSTGEVFEDGLQYFSTHPVIRPLSADTLAGMSPILTAMQACRDEIILLSFVAASDGDFDEDEQDAIVAHVIDRACDPGLTETEVRRRVATFVPDEVAFERALARLSGGGGDPRALMRTMRRVIDADGEIDPEEVAFAHEVESRLRQTGQL